jgi:hypothetical protein
VHRDLTAAGKVVERPVFARVATVGGELVQGALVAAVVVGVEQNDLGERATSGTGEVARERVGVGGQQTVGVERCI